ncbi:hypothetical protein J4430_02720 [Candidatus Woesearchaeota archaeon]|nr:hypothetical protein [Candidatus Woesearchaeota archaeon]
MKLGEVWVSAVLYLALGLILITIVLAAGIPLINKIRDRNTVAQTKDILFVLDKNIRTVASEGTGSKRYVSPVNIDAGELVFDSDQDRLSWSMTTSNKLAEPSLTLQEGVLFLRLDETPISDEYKVNLWLDYLNLYDLFMVSDFSNPFSGTYSLSIENNGTYANGRPTIVLRVA